MKKISFAILIIISTLYGCSTTEKTIETTTELNLVIAPRFSPVSAFEFPDFVEVTLTNGDVLSLPVTWDAARDQFDPTRIGTQTIRGRFLLSDIENPNNLRPSVTIELTRVDWLETLEKTPEFSLFYQAMMTSQVDVSQLAAFTLFAPTNLAFETLLDFLDLTFEELLESDTLDAVVSYHILEGTYSAQDLLSVSPNTLLTFEGTPLTLNFDGEFITVNVINRIIRASEPNLDQTIHRIDGVLLPPNTFAGDLQSVLNNQALNLFADLLSGTDINITQLLGTGFTIFAPNQAAFEAYAEAQGVTLAELIQDPALTDILLNHIVQETVSFDQLLIGAPLTLISLSGEELFITVVDNQVYVNGIPIESSDTTAAIATLHTIGTVILKTPE